MTKIYRETGNLGDKPERTPFSKAHLQPACMPGAAPLPWYNDDEEPSWHPYVVRVVNLDADFKLRFVFIKSDQSVNGPEEVPGECTVDLNNRDDVWIAAPSTIDTKTEGPPAKDKEYGLLFLSTAYTDRPQNAQAQEAGTDSKWPKGSGSDFQKFVNAVRHLYSVSVPDAINQLSADERDRITQYTKRAFRQ